MNEYGVDAVKHKNNNLQVQSRAYSTMCTYRTKGRGENYVKWKKIP